jgi:hypothetical protein
MRVADRDPHPHRQHARAPSSPRLTLPVTSQPIARPPLPIGESCFVVRRVPLASAGVSIHTRSARVPNTVLNNSRGSDLQRRCRRMDRGAARLFHVKQFSIAPDAATFRPNDPLATSTRSRFSAEPRHLCMPEGDSCLRGPPSSRRNQPRTRQPLRWTVQQASTSTVLRTVRQHPSSIPRCFCTATIAHRKQPSRPLGPVTPIAAWHHLRHTPQHQAAIPKFRVAVPSGWPPTKRCHGRTARDGDNCRRRDAPELTGTHRS